MRINSINSHSAYQGNIPQTNNQPKFTALKKINFLYDFNPKKSLEDAEILLEFKKSEPLKRFFEKYDGIAEFAESHGGYYYKTEPYACLKIKYNPNPVEKTIQKEIKEPEKIIEKETKNKGLFNKIKNWLIGKDENKAPRVENHINKTTLKPPIEEIFIDDGTYFSSKADLYESVNGLKQNIRKLTDASLEYKRNLMLGEKLKEQQRTEHLKKVHEELKDWL